MAIGRLGLRNCETGTIPYASDGAHAGYAAGRCE